MAIIYQISELKKSFPTLSDYHIFWSHRLEKQLFENLNALAQTDNKQIYFLNQHGMLPMELA